MTREKLQRLRALKSEVEHLKDEIKEMPYTTGSYVGDTAKDYRTGQGRAVIIQGYSTEKFDRMQRTLRYKLSELQDELSEIEKWLDKVPDPEMRVILRLRYGNGMSWDKVGVKLHCHRTTAQKKHDAFLKTCM